MTSLTDKQMIEIAMNCGLMEQSGSPEIAEDAIPVNRTGGDTQTTGLPPYASDEESRKRRQILIRRLHKLLRQGDERIRKYEVRKTLDGQFPETDYVGLTGIHSEQALTEDSLRSEKSRMLDRLRLLDKPEYWNLSANDAANALRYINHAHSFKALRHALPYLQNVLNASQALPVTSDHAMFRGTLSSVMKHIVDIQEDAEMLQVEDKTSDSAPKKKRKMMKAAEWRKAHSSVKVSPECNAASNSEVSAS